MNSVFTFLTVQNSKSFVWPDVAVRAVVALEKASHDSLSSDYQKYNQKLRQLVFNLKVRRCSSALMLLHFILDDFCSCMDFCLYYLLKIND